MAQEEIVDVLIIGAGASGAAFAWSLAETRMNILCMDQGPWMSPAEYPSQRLNYEARAFGDFAIDPNTRKLPQDYPINATEAQVSPAMYNAIGGSTILWAGHFPRFAPKDFRVWSEDRIAADWPLGYDALAPFFATNDRMMGVSGLAGDPAVPMKQPPLPPLPLGKVGNTLAAGFEKLGWHWWPSDAAILSEPYQGRDKCINLGPCLSGCAQGAKASTDITYWPEAQRRGVRVRPNCRVREITIGSNGLADGVIYYDEAGQERRQRAEMVVVACNGVGTPRLLLNSTSAQFPEGLANRSGMVGQNLMYHPCGATFGLFREPLHGHHGPIGCSLTSHEFYHSDPTRGFKRGYSFEVVRGFGLLRSALWGFSRGLVPWGVNHHDAVGKIFDHSAAVLTITEDLPEAHNRVTLDPELTDSHGIPAPKVTYRLSENTQRMLSHSYARAAEVLTAAGAYEVIPGELLPQAGWHLLGTARMGRDPKTSVVNEWGRSHDVKNLFIIDGSIFVTSGAVNPTSTIQALALYIADAIKTNIGNLFD